MPPWDVHDNIARLFGINPALSRRVNYDIDVAVIHDFGRRIPKGLYLHLDATSGADTLPDTYRARASEARRVIGLLRSNPAYRKAFVLHHAADILSDLLVSANLLGIDPIDIEDRLMYVLRLELGRLTPSLPGALSRADLASVLARLQELYTEIIGVPGFSEWVDRLARARRVDASADPGVVAARIASKALESAARYEDSLAKAALGTMRFALCRHGEEPLVEPLDGEGRVRIRCGRVSVVVDTGGDQAGARQRLSEPSLEYLLGRINHMAVRWAAKASLLFDALLLSAGTIAVQEGLRVSKRRYTFAALVIRDCLDPTPTSIDFFRECVARNSSLIPVAEPIRRLADMRLILEVFSDKLYRVITGSQAIAAKLAP